MTCGGSSASGARGLRGTLSGSGLKEAYRLGREIPQNSNDAARDAGAGVVNLTFRLEQYTGTKRTALVTLLQSESLKGRGVLGDLPDPLPLLFIEDHGASDWAAPSRPTR